MKKKLPFIFIIFSLCDIGLYAEPRSFNEIFPDITGKNRDAVFNVSGYVKSSQKTGGYDLAGNSSACGIDSKIINTVLSKNPGYVVESIMVIPGESNSVSFLDIYNALRNVRDLKGRVYDSASRNQPVPLFEDATRIAGEKNTAAIADPPPANSVPQKETVYIRLKDVNFGNSYYRCETALNKNGLCYSLSNFKNLTYFLIPVIKEGKFNAQLYFEPISEGLLVYSIAGADVSDFISSRIHMNSAIAKRLEVITSWVVDGIFK
jgi:hypothetical protein